VRTVVDGSVVAFQALLSLQASVPYRLAVFCGWAVWLLELVGLLGVAGPTKHISPAMLIINNKEQTARQDEE
jgi:hypothetical protein